MKINQIICSLSILAIVFTGCKKEEEEVLTPQDEHNHHDDGHGDVSLHFHYLINGNALSVGEEYDLNGLNVEFDRIQYYIHDITFYADHMMTDSVQLGGLYLLAGLEDTHFDLGDVEMGHIHMMKFKLGVDPISNSQTGAEFTDRPVSDPLSAQTPSMHWNWNPGSGYKFAVFEGSYNGGSDIIEYHCATDAMLRTTDALMIHMDVDHDSANDIHLMLNLNQVFTDIDIAATNTAHGAQPVNSTLMDHLAGSFSVME